MTLQRHCCKHISTQEGLYGKADNSYHCAATEYSNGSEQNAARLCADPTTTANSKTAKIGDAKCPRRLPETIGFP